MFSYVIRNIPKLLLYFCFCSFVENLTLRDVLCVRFFFLQDFLHITVIRFEKTNVQEHS